MVFTLLNGLKISKEEYFMKWKSCEIQISVFLNKVLLENSHAAIKIIQMTIYKQQYEYLNKNVF